MADYYAKHSGNEKKRKGGVLKKLLKAAGTLILIVVLAFAALIGFLSATEYKPADVEKTAVEGEAAETISPGDAFSVMIWNIGYGALGDNADFFMDGGKSVKTADEERVLSNMDGVIKETTAVDPDILFLQEIDKDSARSNNIDEYRMIQDTFQEYCASFANNFKVAFLPYPIPPIGKVDSGVATFSEYPVSGAERVQLPVPFSWPVRMANLKRCVLVSRVPLKGTDKELVLFNLHLEAYDDGKGKAAQTAMLAEMLAEEADKGNYVIAGGDFNQTFSSVDLTGYEPQPGNWQPGIINEEAFGSGWKFVMDEKTGSCRSLIMPYEGADKDSFQYYVIDGFIVSDNIKVKSAETKDLGFVVSDHNPVVMELKLRK